MQIKDVIEKYNLFALHLTNPDKKYAYTCTLDNALALEKDFIFIPFLSNKDGVYDLIAKAMKNPHCKGFFLNQSTFESENRKPLFHSFMKEFSAGLEVLILAPNIYNLAYSLACENSMEYSVQTIAVVGTDETSTVGEILYKSLEDSGSKVVRTLSNWDCWQKSLEALLVSDENTDFAIVEAVPEKNHLIEYTGAFRKKHVLFTKSSIDFMNVFGELFDISDELAKILNKPQRVLSVHTYLNNELINGKISYEFQDRLQFVSEDKIYGFKQDFYYLNRCYALAESFLKNIGKQVCSAESFEESSPLYTLREISARDYFILNKEKLNVNSVKKSLKLFFDKYKSRQKIVIFEHITGLNTYKDAVYEDIFSELAELNPDVLLLLETKAYIHLFKRHNRNTYVKYLPYDSKKPETAVDVKGFVTGMLTDNSAVYIASKHDLSFLYEEEL